MAKAAAADTLVERNKIRAWGSKDRRKTGPVVAGLGLGIFSFAGLHFSSVFPYRI